MIFNVALNIVRKIFGYSSDCLQRFETGAQLTPRRRIKRRETDVVGIPAQHQLAENAAAHALLDHLDDGAVLRRDGGDARAHAVFLCVRDDEWMFAPERFGGAAMQDVVTLCYSGKYTESEMMGFVRGKGGLVAHLGTSNAIEVEKRIEEGDSHAKLVYDGMLYSNVRAIGALAAAADGKIDRIILTGGLAHSKYVAAYITKKVSFIAPVEVMAGEFELEALAAGACRVLDGEEKAKDFSKLLEKA